MLLQLYCQATKRQQNEYLYLSNVKRQMLNILSQAKQLYQFTQESTQHSKKISTQKIRNKSIEQQLKYRLTCHDVLKAPSQKDIVIQKSIQQRQNSMKKTFVKCPVQAVTRVQNYQIVKQIGKGGFAVVFQVKDDSSFKFAMKQYVLQNSLQCFRNQYIVGEHFFEKGKLKSKFAQKRGGNYIIKYIEKLKNGKKGFIVQQLGGRSLSKMISQIHGVFHKGQRVYEIMFSKFYQELATQKKFNKLLLQIAQGVKLLNGEGFAHCDLKPENILINDEQNEATCKIIDFGSAFLFKHGIPKITITPQYMPPELLEAIQLDNTQAILQKIDVWSIGCIMLQIMTGVPLWFRYKCKLTINGRQNLQLGFFALTNRQYRKIIKKQKELCQGIKRLNFIYPQFEPYRKVLSRILVFDQKQRATLEQVISMLQKLQ